MGGLFLYTYTGENTFPNADKKHAMIRLEDVGPGGEYDSLDNLGKLRAVLEYIELEKIPYHIAVIPRMMNLGDDGVWKERGIDDPNPDAIVKALISLLQQSEQSGAVLGMHGYSHQYGDSVQEGDNQNSGTGAEFNVKNKPVTKERTYAAERIMNSIHAFNTADLTPAFWESPHYQDTREQEKVFRSHIGILYQPDFYSLRSLRDINTYDSLNTYGKNSLGSIYVPAPYSYVTDEQSVEKIVNKAKEDDDLASLFYHPFLEFPFLEPELGMNGEPIIKDGLPVFRYKSSQSYLQRVVDVFNKEGYQWMSLHDIVPFTPAHRVNLPVETKARQIILGDVRGLGHDDVVVIEKHRVVVIPGTYTLPRNRSQNASEIWLKQTFTSEEQLTLADMNHDGKEDLIIYNERTGDVRAAWAGEGEFMPPVSLGKLPFGLQSLQAFQSDNDKGIIAIGKKQFAVGQYENNQLVFRSVEVSIPGQSKIYIGKFQNPSQDDVLYITYDQKISILVYEPNGGFSSPQVIEGVNVGHDEQLLVGDSDGDGYSDIILFSAETGIWREFDYKGNQKFNSIANDFGPWSKGKGKIAFVADFDGNGRTDIGSYDETEHVMDMALSFRSQKPKN
jgi:hypothetical protein